MGESGRIVWGYDADVGVSRPPSEGRSILRIASGWDPAVHRPGCTHGSWHATTRRSGQPSPEVSVLIYRLDAAIPPLRRAVIALTVLTCNRWSTRASPGVALPLLPVGVPPVYALSPRALESPQDCRVCDAFASPSQCESNGARGTDRQMNRPATYIAKA